MDYHNVAKVDTLGLDFYEQMVKETYSMQVELPFLEVRAKHFHVWCGFGSVHHSKRLDMVHMSRRTRTKQVELGHKSRKKQFD